MEVDERWFGSEHVIMCCVDGGYVWGDSGGRSCVKWGLCTNDDICLHGGDKLKGGEHDCW